MKNFNKILRFLLKMNLIQTVL